MGKRLIVWMVAQAFGWVILLKHGDVVNMTGSLPDTINDIGVMFLMCDHSLFMRHFSKADHFADPYVALYMGVVLVMAATINNFLLAAICDGFTAAVGSCFHPPGLLMRERGRAAGSCRRHALPLTRAPSGAGTQREELPENAPQAASIINRLINGTVHKLVYRTFLPSLRSLEVRHPTCLSDSGVRLWCNV
jgi:hypothetical protein